MLSWCSLVTKKFLQFQFLSDQDILVKEHGQQAKPVKEKPTEIEEHNESLSEVDGWIYVPINPKPLTKKR